MRTSYVQVKDPDTGRYNLVPREDYTPPRRADYMIMPDLPDYLSPVDNALVSGRVQRREDLKRTGSRPYEKGEREDAARRVAHEEKALEARMTRTMREVANG